MAQIRRPDGRRTLTVTASPSFAAKWLVPRLERFRLLQPEIDVRIDVSEHLVDFGRERSRSLGDDEKLKPFYKFMTENYELRQRFTPYDGREREIWERKSAGQ